MDAEKTVIDTNVPSNTSEIKADAPPTMAEPASGSEVAASGTVPTHATSKPTSSAENAPAPETPSHGPADAPVSELTETATTSAPAPGEPMSTAEEASQQDTEMNDVTGTTVNDAADAPEDSADANGIAGGKKGANGRRKSGGVPEHKNKKLNKKKSMPKMTHLDAQPGEYYFARLKSYPPWPSIICDEDMLPEGLLNNRPITTKKSDGTYNEAYADGGKKATERTFPVMFLYTNEFGFIPNTDLQPLTPDDCKDISEKGKSKSLLQAYEVAAEGQDLQSFKEMLADHANAMAQEEQRKEDAAAEKAAKAERKKRKSETKVESADVDMDDVDDTAEVKKSAKKRKKVAESDDEETEKPAKTPKTTKIKLTSKTPTTTEKKPKEKSSKPRSERKKSKAAASDEDMADAPEEEPEKPMDPEEARKAREREVLFLRHKLQKGFLSRDQAPQEEDMPQMSNFIKKLENYEDLEVSIIRATKINKVLKALVKLNTIPRDEEHNFRKRSVELLGKWNKILGADSTEGEAATTEKESKSTPTTNGIHDDLHEDKKDEPEPPTTNEAQPDEVVKKVEQVDADETAKVAVIDSIQADSKQPAVGNATSTAESKVDATSSEPAPVEKTWEPSVVERVPESAAGAAEAIEAVKSTE